MTRLRSLILTGMLLTGLPVIAQEPAPPLAPLAPGAPPPETVYVVDDPAGPLPSSRFDRFWIRSGLVIGWSQRSNLPAGFINPGTGTPIGLPASPVSSSQGGFLLDGGLWLDSARTHGIDASYLELYDCYSVQDPTPVFTPAGTFPAALAKTESWFDSADVNYRHPLYERDSFRLDGTLGYRYVGYHDRTRVGTILPDPADNGAVLYKDRADACNDFHGGQLGVVFVYQGNRFAFTASGKVALGAVFSEASLAGLSAGVLYGQPVSYGSTSTFAVVPSASYDVSWRFWGPHRLTAGYQFQYLSRAVRGSDVFQNLANPAVNPLAQTSTAWVQGLTLGLEFRY